MHRDQGEGKATVSSAPAHGGVGLSQEPVDGGGQRQRRQSLTAPEKAIATSTARRRPRSRRPTSPTRIHGGRERRGGRETRGRHRAACLQSASRAAKSRPRRLGSG